MRTRNILKKTLAVVLAFAMLAPLMGNLEVNVKEAKASETTSTVESDDSLDVKFQVTQGVVTETDIEAYKGKYVMRAVSAIQNPDAYDYIRFKAVRADKIEEDMTDEQIEALASEVKVKTVFKRIDSTTGSASGEKETYTYSPKVIDTNSEYFATAKFVITEKNDDTDYVIWVCGSKNGTKVSGPKRQVCVNDGIEGCSTINMSFENTSGVDLTNESALTAKNVDKDSNELGTYNSDIIGVYGNTVNVRVDKKDASEMAISLKSANKFDFYTTGESTALVGSEILRHHTIQYDGTNTDTSWYDLYATDNVRDDFIIATSADLYGFAYLINTKHYSLMQDRVYVISDIVVNKDDVTTWGTSINSGGYDWTPIGNASYQFKGVFDAQMHTISGLYHSVGSVLYNGFFGRTNSATIRNLKLTNCYFRNDNQYFGSVTGYDESSTFETIYSDALVNSSSKNGGGLIGVSKGTTIRNCWFDGRVASSRAKADNMIGGLVGNAYSGTTTIENCLNTGVVNAMNTSVTDGEPDVGGLVGMVTDTVTLTSCFNAGEVKYGVTNSDTSLAGYGAFFGTVTGTVNVTEDKPSYATFESSTRRGYDSDYLIRTNREATLKGVAAATTLQDASFDSAIWTLDSGYTPILKSFESTYVDDTWYKPDSNTTEYVLYDAADLYGLSRLSQANNFEGITIKLGDNITVNDGDKDDWGTTAPERYWLPIGNVDNPFMGTFDGYNEKTGGVYEVSGLYYKATNTGSVGFFSRTGTSATLQNFKLLNSYFHLSNKAYIGSIAGVAKGTIHNVHAEAYVFNTNNRVGGLVGDTGSNTKVDNVVIGLSMTKCSYMGTVESSRTGELRIGGLVGCIDSANTTISDCLNEGTVSATGTSAAPNGIGGLVGYVTNNGSTGTKIENSLNVGTVTSAYATPSNKDSIVGYPNTATIDNLYSTSATDTSKSGFNLVSVDDIKGEDAKTELSGFDFLTTWVARENDTPTLDFENSGAYVIRNLADLNKIVEMSKTTTFAGETIKLAADIVVNDGDADEWAEGANIPTSSWTPIGVHTIVNGNNYRFNGIFDGQGHTISGIYADSSSQGLGLFAATEANAVIKNLNITNSYFKLTGNNRVGSIVGFGKGKFYNIYSDAYVVSNNQMVGGLVGVSGEIEMQNCWFNGSVTSTTNTSTHFGVGGLIGNMYQDNAYIVNCLNTGVINAEANTNPTPRVAGLIGYVYSNVDSVYIDSSLNTGKIKLATDVTEDYGRLVGYKAAVAHVSISNSYATNESLSYDDNNKTTATYELVSEDEIKGTAATDKMPLLDWSVWYCGGDTEFPCIDLTKENFKQRVDYTATAADVQLLNQYYGNLQLAFGDMHAHAEEDLTNWQFDEEKEKAALATWKTEMGNYGLDFIASLDHNQTDHISNEEWDTDLFIYGTEPSAEITGLTNGSINATTGEMHYNMLFAGETKTAAKAKLDAVLNAFSSKFNVGSYNLSDSRYNYANFSKTEFTSLIQTVKENGGFFVIPHPNLSSALLATDWEDYDFGVDKVGFEVVARSLSGDETELSYKYWKELLASGRKYFVTAGSDIHGSLDAAIDSAGNTQAQKAITSVYVSEKNSATYMNQFIAGNFSAGSVGIQMCIGNKVMGSDCDFQDQRLVVKIGDFHDSVANTGTQYRVDIITDKGVVYSQKIGLNTNDVIALDTDEKYMFYRVEVIDERNSVRIAYGNPIWNTNIVQ